MKNADRTLAILTLLASLLPPLITLSYAQLQDEARALLNIKQAVGLKSPNLASWSTSSNGGPCVGKWAGVTCDSSQRIIQLNMSGLSGFKLEGVLPNDAFSNLTSLRSLDFSYNRLKSPFPSLDNLKNLHDLNFSQNHFNGNLPQTIFNLPNLVELRLNENNLTGRIPEGISNLKGLELIWLGGSNKFESPLPKGLALLPNVEILTLAGSAFEENLPKEWAVWVNLTYLNLHTNKFTGDLPSEWGSKFTKLQKLSLYENHLTGKIPDSWKGMISMKEFRLRDNYLSGPVPSWLAQLANVNASVDLKCNYLRGPYPQWFSDANTWMGNCFDSASRSHDDKCRDDNTCEDGPPKSDGKKNSTAAIIGVVVAVAVFCVILVILYILWSRAYVPRSRRLRRDTGAEDWVVPQGVRRFTYKEILKATKSFDKSCEIGEGGFGKVYFGKLEDGKHVAVKRAGDFSHQGMKEFQNEITLLSRLHHRHLVRLEGFCDDKDEQILVYEYMVNGNLHRHLFEKEAVLLNWYRRLEIALTVAQGLDYLHSFAEPPIIHRDVKPSNILLDDNMAAKVSDFGISKANLDMDTHISTRPAGTAGYVDPEYFLRRHLTTASDVYGYGVVLLELITGQLSIDHKRLEDYNLVAWFKPRKIKQGIQAVIDPRLGSNFPVEAYDEVAEIAMDCTAFERGDRPTMKFVASKLEQILSGLIPPPEHFQPVSSTTSEGKASSMQVSPATSRTGATGEVLLTYIKLDPTFNATAFEPR
ncbi:hypothetical protein KP509_37G067300 [Ceratopteris richardii]|uniref:Protein kinase domain-containing protein n=1 Tax=Ceratopteris richardii TaxID=49495 RepID=A0A8T2Q9X7_CERRI|nr:hypothetical protein KP509_37G067300 [Ceratopteris richardii]